MWLQWGGHDHWGQDTCLEAEFNDDKFKLQSLNSINYFCFWWNSPKRMELDCRVCGKALRQRGGPAKQVCSGVFLANHPRPFQWLFLVQWIVIFRQKGVCPAQESNPRPSAFRADALTTELRGWDDSTRRNIVTQLCLAFRAVLTLHGLCAMGTTPAAAMAVLGVISVQHFCPFEGSQTRSKQSPV